VSKKMKRSGGKLKCEIAQWFQANCRNEGMEEDSDEYTDEEEYEEEYDAEDIVV